MGLQLHHSAALHRRWPGFSLDWHVWHSAEIAGQAFLGHAPELAGPQFLSECHGPGQDSVGAARGAADCQRDLCHQQRRRPDFGPHAGPAREGAKPAAPENHPAAAAVALAWVRKLATGRLSADALSVAKFLLARFAHDSRWAVRRQREAQFFVGQPLPVCVRRTARSVWQMNRALAAGRLACPPRQCANSQWRRARPGPARSNHARAIDMARPPIAPAAARSRVDLLLGALLVLTT